MAKYVHEITVRKEDGDKRESLLGRVSASMVLSGQRVFAGDYKVTITRLKPTKEGSNG